MLFRSQIMYYIEKYGIDSFLKRKGIKNKIYYLSHLKGVLEYAYFINKNDIISGNSIKKVKTVVKTLAMMTYPTP